MSALSTLRAEASAASAAGETGRALDRLHALWAQDPTAATASFVLRVFAALRPSMPWVVPFRATVLRSFTVEPIVPLARAEAALHGVDLTIDVGEFGVVATTLLDPTGPLREAPPDLVIVAQRLRDLAPELEDGFADRDRASVDASVDAALAQLDAQLRAFRARSAARLLVHDVEPPSPTLGLLDANVAGSQHEAIARLRLGLRERARALRDVHVLDVAAQLAPLGGERAHDPIRWLTMRLPYRAEGLLALARAWVSAIVPMTPRAAKVVVSDLDDTLWGGILGEDGREGITLGVEHPGAHHRAYQRALLDLKRRGLLLAIASKNDEADALATLAEHPEMLVRPADLAATQIHWRPKAESLRAIAGALSLGVDSLLFVDDNPVERAAIREALPMVHVLDLPVDAARYAGALAAHPAVQRLSLSQEDRERAAMVAADRERATLAEGAGSVEGFLRSLGMTLEWAALDAGNVDRVAQLTQKTNQLNVTTRRRSAAELEALVREGGLVRAARVRDRFGDQGVVGVIVGVPEGERAELDTFLLSCRVIGRTVETAMLALFADELRTRGVTTLEGWFLPSAKNAPARDLHPRHGFVAIESHDDGRVRYRLPLEAAPTIPDWFALAGVAKSGR